MAGGGGAVSRTVFDPGAGREGLVRRLVEVLPGSWVRSRRAGRQRTATHTTRLCWFWRARACFTPERLAARLLRVAAYTYRLESRTAWKTPGGPRSGFSACFTPAGARRLNR